MGEKVFVKVDLENEGHCQQLLQLLNLYMEDIMGNNKPMPINLGPRIIAGLKNHSSYLGFFVKYKSEFVALANCNYLFSTFAAKPLINIHDFIVNPAFRRKGIGKFLLDKIAEYALAEGCAKITLEVRDDNIKAKNLYKKVGFSSGNPSYLFWEKKLG